jgi:hypothetical protein
MQVELSMSCKTFARGDVVPGFGVATSSSLALACSLAAKNSRIAEKIANVLLPMAH